MTDDDVIQKIADKLQTAFIQQPTDDNGGRRTQIAFSDDDSRFLARTALLAARDAGFDFDEAAALAKVSRMPALESGATYRRFYTSSSGDTWDLGKEISSGRVFVRHRANAASGGSVTDSELEAFLAGNRSNAEAQALRELLGTLTGPVMAADVRARLRT